MGMAVIGSDPNSRDQPLSRQTKSAFAGLLVAAIAVAGATVFGLLRPGGNNAWRDGKGLIVEKETGTRYLFRDGVLYPVLNYASALLILGDSKAATRSVSGKSLRSAPHGPPVGIPGAPESLPKAGELLRGVWQICARPGRARDGTSRAALTVAVLDGPTADRTPIADDRALVVRGPSGAIDVVWRGQLLRIRTDEILTALGYRAVEPVPVTAGWLNLLQRGPDLAAMPLVRLGEALAEPVDGRLARIGQVFKTGGVAAAEQFFVLTADGMVAVSPLQAAIQLAEPGTAAAYPGRLPKPISVSAAATAGARSAADPAMPQVAPKPITVDPGASAVCFDLTDGATGLPRPYLQPVPGPLPLTSERPPVDAYGSPIADKAGVPPGRAILVVAQSFPTRTDGASYLVTDLGVRYPLSTDGVKALGFDAVTPVRQRDAAVSLFPTGPRLDPADAGQLQLVVPHAGDQTADGLTDAATNPR
jgi:type VII secretion protein EccB